MKYFLRHHGRIVDGLSCLLVGVSGEIVVGELRSDFRPGLERRRIGKHLNVIEIAITKCNKRAAINQAR